MWENRPNAVDIHQTRGFLPGDKLLANQLSSDLDDASGSTYVPFLFNAPLLQVNGWIIWTRSYLGFLTYHCCSNVDGPWQLQQL